MKSNRNITVPTYILNEPRSELGGDCVEEETEDEDLSFLSFSFFSFLSFCFFLSVFGVVTDEEEEPCSGVEGDRIRLLPLCDID